MIAENWAIMRTRIRNALFAHFRLCRNEAASIARSIIFAKLRVSTEVETSIFSEQIVILQRVKY